MRKNRLRPDRTRDRKFLNWISTLDCLGCRKVATLDDPGDPDHVNKEMQGSMAKKAADKQVVPLCRKCHNLRHQKGVKWFYGEHLGRSQNEAAELGIELYNNRYDDDKAKWLMFAWANPNHYVGAER